MFRLQVIVKFRFEKFYLVVCALGSTRCPPLLFSTDCVFSEIFCMEHGNSNADNNLYFGYTHTSHAKPLLPSVRSRPAHSIWLAEVCCLSLSYPLEAVFHILLMVGLALFPNSIKGLFWRCVHTAWCFCTTLQTMKATYTCTMYTHVRVHCCVYTQCQSVLIQEC